MFRGVIKVLGHENFYVVEAPTQLLANVLLNNYAKNQFPEHYQESDVSVEPLEFENGVAHIKECPLIIGDFIMDFGQFVYQVMDKLEEDFEWADAHIGLTPEHDKLGRRLTMLYTHFQNHYSVQMAAEIINRETAIWED